MSDEGGRQTVRHADVAVLRTLVFWGTKELLNWWCPDADIEPVPGSCCVWLQELINIRPRSGSVWKWNIWCCILCWLAELRRSGIPLPGMKSRDKKRCEMLGLAQLFAAKQAKIVTNPRYAAFDFAAVPWRLLPSLPFRQAMSLKVMLFIKPLMSDEGGCQTVRHADVAVLRTSVFWGTE